MITVEIIMPHDNFQLFQNFQLQIIFFKPSVTFLKWPFLNHFPTESNVYLIVKFVLTDYLQICETSGPPAI